MIVIPDYKKVAQTDYKVVTIRFYGRNGYSDIELSRDHKLIES